MKKYVKKPVVIEAVQLPADMNDNCGFQADILAWMMKTDSSIEPGENLVVDDDGWHITTLEGTMLANWHDWIIRGVEGEFYPCKDPIFQATYKLDAPKRSSR